MAGGTMKIYDILEKYFQYKNGKPRDVVARAHFKSAHNLLELKHNSIIEDLSEDDLCYIIYRLCDLLSSRGSIEASIEAASKIKEKQRMPMYNLKKIESLLPLPQKKKSTLSKIRSFLRSTMERVINK